MGNAVVVKSAYGFREEGDPGTTNSRKVKSKHRRRWPRASLHSAVNSSSEFKKTEGGDIWFALDETVPLACFAGIWPNWMSIRKVKEGETTNEPLRVSHDGP